MSLGDLNHYQPTTVTRLRIAFILSLTALTLTTLSGCSRDSEGLDAQGREIATGGDPQRGKGLIQKYGCTACHVIDGVESAIGQVGPPLTNIKVRSYVAGMLSNTPANLQHWIMNPTEVNPKTAMPDLGVTEEDARDIAAYLYSQ